MPLHEVIDLSLSTDNEASPVKLPVLRAELSRPAQRTTDFIPLLSDDFDTSLFLDEPEPPRKRRKVTPPLDNQKESLSKSRLIATADVSYNAGPTTDPEKSRPKKRPIEPDPTLFMSSPYKPLEIASKPHDAKELLSPDHTASDDEFPSDFYKISPKRPGLSTQLSGRTKALLAEISDNAKLPHNRSSQRSKKVHPTKKDRITNGKGMERGRSAKTSASDSRDETARRTRLTSSEKFAREREKAQEKARKIKEKEDEKERKQLQKEEKAREKQIAADLAEVNKARTDKKITTPEMIVDLPISIEETTLDTQTRAFLDHLHVQTTTYHSPVPNVIQWRRKVDCTFNEGKGHWVPVSESIEKEKNIACLLSAKDFVSLATSNSTGRDGQNLENHVIQLKRHFPDSFPIYLIEGLDAWMRKNKSSRNRAYQKAVLSQAGVQVTSKRKKPAEEIVDEDIIEDALLQLQVVHGCLIHHTIATVQTAEWIAIFTQHISQIPYRFVYRLYFPSYH